MSDTETEEMLLSSDDEALLGSSLSLGSDDSLVLTDDDSDVPPPPKPTKPVAASKTHAAPAAPSASKHAAASGTKTAAAAAAPTAGATKAKLPDLPASSSARSNQNGSGRSEVPAGTTPPQLSPNTEDGGSPTAKTTEGSGKGCGAQKEALTPLRTTNVASVTPSQAFNAAADHATPDHATPPPAAPIDAESSPGAPGTPAGGLSRSSSVVACGETIRMPLHEFGRANYLSPRFPVQKTVKGLLRSKQLMRQWVLDCFQRRVFNMDAGEKAVEKSSKSFDIKLLALVERHPMDKSRLRLCFGGHGHDHDITFPSPNARERFVELVQMLRPRTYIFAPELLPSVDTTTSDGTGTHADDCRVIIERHASTASFEDEEVVTPRPEDRSPEGRSNQPLGADEGLYDPNATAAPVLKSPESPPLSPKKKVSFRNLDDVRPPRAVSPASPKYLSRLTGSCSLLVSRRITETVKIWVGTHNLAGMPPSNSASKLATWIPRDGFDLYCVCVQQLAPSDADAWSAVLTQYLTATCLPLMLVKSDTVALFVLARKSIIGRIANIESARASVPFSTLPLVTGTRDGSQPRGGPASAPAGATAESTGVVAMSLRVLETSVLFVGAALPHSGGSVSRNAVLRRALGAIRLGHPDHDVVAQHDHVFFAGDVGYTLIDVDPEALATSVADERFGDLMAKDQFTHARNDSADSPLHLFEEAPVNFAPTAFVEGGPAYLSRILYFSGSSAKRHQYLQASALRTHSTASSAARPTPSAAAAAKTATASELSEVEQKPVVAARCVSYSSAEELVTSPYLPVRARFVAQAVRPAVAALMLRHDPVPCLTFAEIKVELHEPRTVTKPAVAIWGQHFAAGCVLVGDHTHCDTMALSNASMMSNGSRGGKPPAVSCCMWQRAEIPGFDCTTHVIDALEKSTVLITLLEHSQHSDSIDGTVETAHFADGHKAVDEVTGLPTLQRVPSGSDSSSPPPKGASQAAKMAAAGQAHGRRLGTASLPLAGTFVGLSRPVGVKVSRDFEVPLVLHGGVVGTCSGTFSWMKSTKPLCRDVTI